jgi:phage-related protein
MELRIEAYQSSSGKQDAYDFITSQPDEASFKITKKLDQLSQYGVNFMVDKRDVKPINSHRPHFYELRVKACGTCYRLPFVIIKSTVILMFGFKKQTDKMEKKHLNLAINRAKEILN